MSAGNLVPYRRKICEQARGRVLEIGAGGGLNFRFYPVSVSQLVAIEPEKNLQKRARRRARLAKCPVRLLDEDATALPFGDAAFDIVISSWTLCSIPDWEKALSEIRRVLKRDGRFVFIEHGLADDAKTACCQAKFMKFWRGFAGGCVMNRPIADGIKAAGFEIERLEIFDLGWPKILTHSFMGSALVARDVL